MTNPDRAYWITWYNLSDANRDAHLKWVEQCYMPKVLAREGVLWGAHYASLAPGEYTPLGGAGGRIAHKPHPQGVPPGDRYILIFGAADAYALANPTPAEFHAMFSDADKANWHNVWMRATTSCSRKAALKVMRLPITRQA